MLRVPTGLLTFFGLVFGLFHAVLGLLWLNKNDRAEIVIAALIAYVAILVPSMIVGKSRAMKRFQAWINVVVCALIPLAINTQLDPSHLGDYATWYVLGVGTILGGTAVRGRRGFAWIGLLVLVAEIAAWGGVGSLAVAHLGCYPARTRLRWLRLVAQPHQRTCVDGVHTSRLAIDHGVASSGYVGCVTSV